MEIKKLLVAGAGQMGNGMAQVAAQAGYEVVMTDIAEEFVVRGMGAIEKNLAILCNSDVHAPIHQDYVPHAGDHRPITLVFAKERSADSIRA